MTQKSVLYELTIDLATGRWGVDCPLDQKLIGPMAYGWDRFQKDPESMTFGGGLLAALTLRLLFGTTANLGLTSPAGSALQAFGMEVLLTGILVFVIACVALRPGVVRALAAPAIGGAVALEALFAGPISGASMNPARSLAPALVSGRLEHLAIYLTAPFLGGLIGILLFHALGQKEFALWA